MDFLATARALQKYTIQKCLQMPKRYTFYVGVPLADHARAVYDCAKKANSIYPLNKHEAQLRRDYFLEAYAELQALISQIELAHEIVQFDVSIMQEWSGLIKKELDALKGTMKSDRERYKKLPD